MASPSARSLSTLGIMLLVLASLFPFGSASAHKTSYCGHGKDSGIAEGDEWEHSHNRTDGSFKHVHHIGHYNAFTAYTYESHRICGTWRGTCNGPSCAIFLPDVSGLDHPEASIPEVGGVSEEV